ncbi:PREDICTED: serine protease easter-like [Rhagoletis zephyria]|uniref:serine protease easter-like n=1 Tax=Rhagoletis zephyria TaxID=28612 RepID=UPI00081192C3|nr:PREDICTED: serine protease easter-like [Rhagoletis zephyria]
MQYNKVYWLLLIFSSLQSTFAQYYSCLTPYNTYGRCVPYNKCGFLQKLFTQYGLSLPQNYLADIQKSRCQGSTPGIHICCDDTLSLTTAPMPPTDPTPPIFGGSDENDLNYVGSMNQNGLKILRAQKCGNAGGERVSHGKDVNLSEFPWMALLIYNSEDDRFKCGGSLITENFVLTAAHCMVGVAEKIIGVRLGEHDLSEEEDCITVHNSRRICAPPIEDIGVERTIPHPGYNNARKTNDVGLVKLNRPVHFQKHIKPICLPIIPEAGQIPTDRRFFIAGWGGTENSKTSNILQKALVPFKTREQCQMIFRRTRINENHLCAGGDGLIDTCKGDSGGPLFYLAPYSGPQKTLRYVQYGIVSFGGTECGSDKNSPGIYANVAHFMPWITSHIV